MLTGGQQPNPQWQSLWGVNIIHNKPAGPEVMQDCSSVSTSILWEVSFHTWLDPASMTVQKRKK